MNTHNHHKVIDKVSEKLKNISFDVNVLYKASDFTDDFCDESEWESIKKGITDLQINQESFFYYHFYYDLKVDKGEVGKGTISLFRRNENNSYNQIEESMSHCDYDKIQFEKPLFKDPEDRSPLNTQKKYKKFFTYINNRENYLRRSIFDSSNQSDCVAFLHAMGAENDSQPEKEFIDHLKKCFTEFLFLKNENDALFILGIALHSIMDSFTPSHMGFQKYTEQDMANHAQGDVIVFNDDNKVRFDPGQYTDDGKASNGKTKMAARFKGYNSDDYISVKEFEMFKIFTVIGAINKNEKIKEILNRNILEYNSKTDKMEYISISRKKLNEKIEDIIYGESAFVYSNAAIEVCQEVLEKLFTEKTKIRNYKDYIKKKQSKEIDIEVIDPETNNISKTKGSIIDFAINIWEKKYNNLTKERKILFAKIRLIRGIRDEEKNPFAV